MMNRMKIRDKRKIILWVIPVPVLIIMAVILLTKKGADQSPATESAVYDVSIAQDEDGALAGGETIALASTDITPPLEQPASDTPAQDEVVRNIPDSIWKEAFELYGKTCDAKETVEAVMPQVTELAGSDEETDAYLKALNDLFSYWDGVNEKGFVSRSIPEDLQDDGSLCIVILGYALTPSGEVRDELICRLDAGMEAAAKYPNARVLVTGGGTALFDPSVKEADKMAEYLIQKGLDPSRLIVENDSMTTSENAIYSEKVLRTAYPDVRDIMIVTSDYHVPMACQIFEGWFIMNDSDLEVISNYACDPGNPTVFRISDQVFWMEELLR